MVQQIDRYMKSIHARPSRADQSRTNATCYNCHDAHYVYPPGSEARTEWRLNIPNTCGKCHAKQREEYAKSVHGKAVLEDKNQYAAVCSDCRSTHDVESPAKAYDPARHRAELRQLPRREPSHLHDTYHGQVTTLGYATPPSASTATAATRSAGDDPSRRWCIRTTGWRPASATTPRRPADGRRASPASSRTATRTTSSAIRRSGSRSR